MKLVLAYVNPYRVDDIIEAIRATEISGLTVVEAQGFGRQAGHQEVYRGAEYSIDFVPKVRIDVVIDDEQVEAVVDAITTSARSGQIGDGKIFVTDVEQAIRIRTGETGSEAL